MLTLTPQVVDEGGGLDMLEEGEVGEDDLFEEDQLDLVEMEGLDDQVKPWSQSYVFELQR
jgi:hypothetical protein